MFLRVAVFYVATLVFSGLLIALQGGIGPDPDLLELVQFAPALGVGLMFVLFRRTTRVEARFTPVEVVARKSALVAGIVVAAMAVSVAIHLVAGQPLHLDEQKYPLWALTLTMLIGSAGEELGWRAYLQPYLQTRYSVLRSSLVVGFLWGVWHVGGFANGPVFMGAFLVMTISLSVVLGAVLRTARGTNLAVATVAHTVVNLSMFALFDEESGHAFPMVVMGGAWAVAAVVTHRALRPVEAARVLVTG
ncbi:CPBP family intramembrane glutamic endopeptidase [Kribbella lupini]|uniref:CAAX prenyl protease 2/Lysostaphin resistance protein A-like domain-containing protein n=1 Tax=Kribbella lupini TaxID=291602 RepID=A0ABP4MC77_9ACTN